MRHWHKMPHDGFKNEEILAANTQLHEQKSFRERYHDYCMVYACKTRSHIFRVSEGLTKLSIISHKLEVVTLLTTECNLFPEFIRTIRTSWWYFFFCLINNYKSGHYNQRFSECRSFDLARAASTARAKRLPSLVRAHSSMAARHFFAASGSRLSLTYNREWTHIAINRARWVFVCPADNDNDQHREWKQTDLSYSKHFNLS